MRRDIYHDVSEDVPMKVAGTSITWHHPNDRWCSSFSAVLCAAPTNSHLIY